MVGNSSQKSESGFSISIEEFEFHSELTEINFVTCT
jgi:hypothetical protein